MKIIISCLLNIFRLICINLQKDGFKKIVSENIILKQQLVVTSRKLNKCPPLNTSDRIIFSAFSLFIDVKRIPKTAIIISKETLLKFHRALIKRKYSILFGQKSKEPGRKRISTSLRNFIVETKEKNPTYGSPKIVALVLNILNISISEETVRNILIKYYRPLPGNGPSWLAKIGDAENKLWSLDFFRVETAFLHSLRVMVVIDQFSRKIIGFKVCKGNLTGNIICNMFEDICNNNCPKYLSTDNDPLFRFKTWKQDLEFYDISEIKSVPHVPFSHPFIERLIGTVRRDFTDRTILWSKRDAELKLDLYKDYYNNFRVHDSLNGKTPFEYTDKEQNRNISLNSYRWIEKCGGLFSTPAAIVS